MRACVYVCVHVWVSMRACGCVCVRACVGVGVCVCVGGCVCVARARVRVFIHLIKDRFTGVLIKDTEVRWNFAQGHRGSLELR